MVAPVSAIAGSEPLLAAGAEPRRKFLGSGTPRGYGLRPRLTPEAAAAFATFVDAARTRAGLEGRTLVYTVRWG
ncbi:MAG: hypothetical protein L3K14_08045 [Thermoplasmata archaeon]|nr:hypothetical protein [Thermoplasmata archaeon]